MGNCYLQSQMLSLKTIDGENSTTDIKIYIKVQNVPSAVPPPQQTHHAKKKHPLEVILGSSLGSLLFLSLLIGIFVFLFWKKENIDEDEEYYLDHVLGMPTRYSQ